MMLTDVVSASRHVAATPKRTEKVALLADLLRRTPHDEIMITIGLLTGSPRQGRVGIGWAALTDITSPAAQTPTLTVADVDRALDATRSAQGSGSQRDRARLMADLFGRATADEQALLFRVLTGEMRQGANEGVVADAVAKASGLMPPDVRRAAMLLGDLGAAATRALTGQRLDAIGLTTLVGVQPMLAGTSASVSDALALTGPASVEYKLDGARIQVHRRGDDIRVFTRSLREISDKVPEIVSRVQSLPADEFVLDGEALGLDIDGAPLKFQDTMNVDTTLRPFFFDVLSAGRESMIDRPLHERKMALAEVVPAGLRLPTVDTGDTDVGERFAAEALSAGHEGVVVKALDSLYQAGRRGATWRKVKPVHTLDLVVLAAEWGHGRRAGWLSNIHLGARGADGTFVMVGKTFKGMTDEILRWQTETFPGIQLGSEGHVMWLQPEFVAEIALDGVQRSTRYPGGVALRFARVRRYRLDKRPADADTIERVQSLL